MKQSAGSVEEDAVCGGEQQALRGYVVHGLSIRSEIPLARPRQAAAADLLIRWGRSHRVPSHRPKGELLATLEPPFGDYSFARTASGYLVRFPRLCDFEVAASRRSIAVHPSTDTNPDVVQLLLGGNVLALLLGLAGKTALHATAVRVARRTIAIVGASGAGKSTLAAMFCSSGAECVSEDLLRVEINSTRAYCFRGASEIRLRPAAAELSAGFAPNQVGSAGDGRLTIAARPPRASKLSLDAILVPKPSKRAKRLRLERLGPRDALEQLIRYPRITGWRAIEPIQRHFLTATRLAGLVPVYAATIPWGPPFSDETPSLLLEGMATADTRPTHARPTR